MEDEIQEALEAAASPRLKTGWDDLNAPRTPTVSDVRAVRRTISLFLESLDPELTVSELRHHLT